MADWNSTTDEEFAKLCAAVNPDPLNEADGMAWPQFAALCAAEQAQLPDPYAVDPEPLFSWFADDVLNEVEIRPADNSATTKATFDAVDEYLGLNRAELRTGRWFLAYEPIRDAKAQLDASTPGSTSRQLALDALKRRMKTDRPFAGMVCSFVKVQWGLGL